MLKGIATQGELATFQDSLNRMAANLAYHVNETPQPPALPHPIGSSLSLAHGVDMIIGYVDADGNDLRTYEDAGGDRVSDAFSTGKANFIRFIVAGIPYYAPLQDSTLAGQDVSSGALVSVDSTQGTPSGCALITDYVTVEAQTAENIDSLLREHIQKPAEKAHIPLTVTPTIVYDSAGHALNTHLLNLQFGGVVFTIPVSTRLGGPYQPIRGLAMSGPNSVTIPENASNACDVFINATTTGGTLPISYQFQYQDGAVWKNFSATGAPVTQAYTITGWGPGLSAITSSPVAALEIISVDPGSGSTAAVAFRVIATNAAGSVTSAPFVFSATDYTGNWIIMEALAHRMFTSREQLSLYRLRLWALKHHPDHTQFYLGRNGKELVRRAREAGFDFKTLLPTVEKLLEPGSYMSRYHLFYETVIALLKRYWPECPHPLARAITGSPEPLPS